MPLGPLLMVNPRRKSRKRRPMPKRNRNGRFVKTPKRKRRKNPWASSGRSGGQYVAYEKPKVRTYRRGRKKPAAKKKRKFTIVSRRRKNMPKSRKRSLAAKKAWRKRKRNTGVKKRRVANPKRRVRRKYKRRRNAYVSSGRSGGQIWVDLRTKSGKVFRKKRRKTSTRKGRKTVARKKRKTTVRRKKRKSYSRKKWPQNFRAKHKRAARKGWRKRRVGKVRRKGRTVYLRTSRGRRVKRPYKSRRTGRYMVYRNPDMVKDIALPLALASVGFIGSALLMTAGPVTNILAKQSPAVQKFAKIGIPIAAALGIMMFAPKVKALAKYSKHMYFLAFGLALAGGVAGIREALAGTAMGAKLGLSGYVVQPMRGYVRRPMAGYVRRAGMGQIEERAGRTLGAPIEYRGALVPAHLPGQRMQRAIGYQPSSSKPYGLGLPTETRRYNEFGWTGVYNQGSYENS